MKTVIYVGPFDAVDGEGLHFVKGEPVEVSPSLAKALLRQAHFITQPAITEKDD